MNSFTTITYRWQNQTSQEVGIASEHKELLQEHALERINEQSKLGFTSGELFETLSVDNTDDEFEYAGWWDIKTN